MTSHDISVSDLAKGDVVYFDYLHLNTARRSEKQSSKNQHFYYEVEGKARPALVVGDPMRKNSMNWHFICHLTTKGRDEQGEVKKRHKPIGYCIDPERKSYVCCDPEWYPENLVSVENGLKRKRLDTAELSSLVKIIGNAALHA